MCVCVCVCVCVYVCVCVCLGSCISYKETGEFFKLFFFTDASYYERNIHDVDLPFMKLVSQESKNLK